jgi:transposase InsO family protein
MRRNDIRAKMKRAYKGMNFAKSNYENAGNKLKNSGPAKDQNSIWVADMTYIKTRQGWLFLTAVMDLYSRKIVGWSTSSNRDCKTTVEALQKAITTRQPGEGLLIHTDQGSEFTNYDFIHLAKKNGFINSMSRRGNCYDNAYMESFFHTLKTEMIYFESFKTRDEAKSKIFDYLEIFYNRKRRHSSLGYKSPIDFEREQEETVESVH